MADSTSGHLNLPVFVNDRTYLLTGATLNSIVNVIRENKLVLIDGKFKESGIETGSVLETISLTVCIDGVRQKKKFLVAQ